MGSGGEAPRPSGMHIISFPNKFSLFTLGALWSLGEPEEDEGEAEEPKVCTTEQAEFDLAHTWLEEGGAPALSGD